MSLTTLPFRRTRSRTLSAVLAVACVWALGASACFPDLEVLQTCADGLKSGDETDVDCGGLSGCPSCNIGQSCGSTADCAQGSCNQQRCSLPVAVAPCENRSRDANEADIDCGGASDCARCGDGAACSANSDCVSSTCVSEHCVSVGCANGRKDPSESDVDCGGPDACNRCPESAACAVSTDCSSGSCVEGRCRVDPCTDKRKDATESDVDCGGTSQCVPCVDGAACSVPSDCRSGRCNGSCFGDTCDNDLRDNGETDVDCGGPNECVRCALGLVCVETPDCAAGVCQASRCREVDPCINRVRDGTETDIDCGGPCNACPDGGACVIGADCTSGLCTEKACAPRLPSCTDGRQNGDETDVDCGGACAPARRCAVRKACAVGADCGSFLCREQLCVSEEVVAPGDRIDDMEDGDQTLPVNGTRGGTRWFIASDKRAGSQLMGGAPVPSPILNGRPSSSYGIRFAGSGFSDWGAALSFELKPRVAGAATTFDASVYKGLAFWARASNTSHTISIAVIDANTDAEFQTCTRCWDYHQLTLPLTPEWALYKVRFDELRQVGYGVPQRTYLDAKAVWAVRFATLANQVFDFWIDDVAFFR